MLYLAYNNAHSDKLMKIQLIVYEFNLIGFYILISMKFVVGIEISSFFILIFVPVTIGCHLLMIIVNFGLKIWLKIIMRKVVPITNNLTTTDISSIADRDFKGTLYLDFKHPDNTSHKSWIEASLHSKSDIENPYEVPQQLSINEAISKVEINKAQALEIPENSNN